MLDQRVDPAAGIHPPGLGDDPVEVFRHGAFLLAESGQVQTQVPRPADPCPEIILRRPERAGVHDPTGETRLPSLAGEAPQVLGPHPAALGDDPVDRAIRSGHRGRQARVDVEDLAAPDRLGPAALAQHETVARLQRQPPGEVQADDTLLSRSQRLGAEDAHAHAELARAQVGHVRPPAGHLVIE